MFLEVACSSPPDGNNTEAVNSTITAAYKESYTYQCLTGYEFDGCLETTCTADDTWSLDPPPACTAIKCPTPLAGINTESVPNVTYTYSDTYMYECIDGYLFDGNMQSNCTENGTWSLDPPHCTSESQFSLCRLS